MKFAKVEAEEGIEDLFSSKCKEGTMLNDEKKSDKEKPTSFIFEDNSVGSTFLIA